MTKEERWLLDEKYGGVESPEFEADRARLAGGEPVAYVIGWQPFLGLKIYLDSKPLIPRPETEHWTEQLLNQISAESGPGGFARGESRSATARGEVIFQQKNTPLSSRESPGPLRFLDLCAGSGAIGCAILKNFPTAHVSFGESDPAHEATIRKNICENGLLPAQAGDENRADVRIGDLFAPFIDERFDYILANPPYIPEGRSLEASVAEYEPSLALRSGEDGLDLIRRIAEGLRRHLKPAGEAWIECDSAHADTARALFVERGFLARTEKDQFGRERLLVIS